MKFFCDNQNTIHLAKNIAYHSKKKHIFVNYHFVRQVIDEGGVTLEKFHTQKNIVDMFTKPISLDKLPWYMDSLVL